MREILFRGKTNEGKWIEGQLLHFKASVGSGELAVIVEGGEWDNSNEWFNLGKRAKVLTETVGQYTGFTDKNGKKIFEGDIVEGTDFTPEDGGYGFVSFDDGAFEVEGNNTIGTFHENYWGKDFEVIGNIHDNPELLSEGE